MYHLNTDVHISVYVHWVYMLCSSIHYLDVQYYSQ